MVLICDFCQGYGYAPRCPVNISMTLFLFEVCKKCTGNGFLEVEGES